MYRLPFGGLGLVLEYLFLPRMYNILHLHYTNLLLTDRENKIQLTRNA